MTDTLCASVWPAGLYGGLLIECDRQAKHTGPHSHLDYMTWTGTPLPGEQPMIDALTEWRQRARLTDTEHTTPKEN